MLSVDIRVVPDEDDLTPVNLYDKPGWKTVPELPSERNSSTLEVVFVYFAGYGKLFVLFKYGDMFTLGLVKDENPVI